MHLYRIICLLLFVNILYANGPDKQYYFYRPQIHYGSECIFSPFTLFINGGFDILRNGSHSNNNESEDILALDYRNGFSNVWTNITHPFFNIKAFGWKDFVANEIFPIKPATKRTQYVPNYLHHAIGGGMLYVKTAEWFDYRDVPLPYINAFLVATAYQFTNEALENNHYRGTNVDPIADMLIFNPMGYILFSFDSVKRFFSRTVRLYDWSLQPAINPFDKRIDNAGQQFVAKFDLPFLKEKWTGFFYWGINGIAGLSYALNNKDNLSFGLGTVVNRLKENSNRNARFLSPLMDGSMAFFWDRDNSLLMSAIFTGPKLFNLRLNIYPGLFSLGPFLPGFYAGIGEWDGFVAGITFINIPIGISGAKRRL